MSLLTNIVSLLTSDIRATLFSLFIAYIVYRLSKFYLKAFSLPPGPIPLPILGNVTYFKGTKEHWATELEKVADKYGPVFTMWMGTFPLVFISDIEIAREAFRKNDFVGRPNGVFAELLKNGESRDIMSADYGHQWEALRRVAHSAVQKFSKTDKLVYIVSDCVDNTIKTIIDKEGFNKPFSPFEYIYSTFLNILATSACGQRYELDDPEYLSIKYFLRDFFRQVNQEFFFWEMLPITRKFSKNYKKMAQLFQDSFQLFRSKLQNHYKDYNESTIRDFCDTLIFYKNEALREGKESALYLTDDNLAWAISDLFFAGTDTSQNTFRWILFFMTYYPNVLKKLRKEIEEEVGDRIPTHEDRERCHYVMAVITESMRLRNIVPLSVPHKAVVTSKIGKYTIPEGTQVTVFQNHIMHNEEYWPKANEFIPERFLENGEFVKTRPKAHIPFGIGRRVCLGEKLAMADLFLVVVRFIQKTADYDVIIDFNGDTKPDPNNSIDFHPKDYKISFKNK